MLDGCEKRDEILWAFVGLLRTISSVLRVQEWAYACHYLPT